MELRQLVYFDAVVRHEGFTRAAEVLHVAQPAVSAQIRSLERELGTTLLHRTTRRVALTHAGEVFLVRVRTALGELHRGRGDLAELAEVDRGEVRLGAALATGAVDLVRTIAAFRDRHPGVALSLRTGLVAELRTALDAGDLDLLVVPLDPATRARRRTRVLAEETVVLVTESGRAPSDLRAVRDEPFVCLPADSGLRAILDTACRRAGFTPRVDFEVRTAAAVRQLVAAGVGVALIAGSAAREPGAPVTVHPLDPAPRHPPIGIAEPVGRRTTPAARAFRDALLAASG